MRGPPFLIKNPGEYLPGRIVPDVLRMAALELGNPFPFEILSKSDITLLAHAALPAAHALDRLEV